MNGIGNEDPAATFNAIADEIAIRHVRLDDMASRYDVRMTSLKSAHDEASRRTMGDWWTLVAYQGAYVKLRLIVEQHFIDAPAREVIFANTIGLMAASRYVFELIVWLKTLEKDPKNGLTFRLRVVTNDLRHRRDSRDQMTREITLFRDVAKEEARLLVENIEDIGNRSMEEVGRAAKKISDDIDRKARGQFSIYARQAQQTSYYVCADFLETKAVPKLSAQIRDLEREEAGLLQILQLPNNAGSKKWQWDQRAEAVGMKEQYQLFYRYASRLLHAEPDSFATHQPDLESYEISALLDYILASIDEAVALGRTVLKRFPRPTPP